MDEAIKGERGESLMPSPRPPVSIATQMTDIFGSGVKDGRPPAGLVFHAPTGA